MYRFLLILLSVVGMATATGAQQRQDMNKGGSNHKILVAYFSATGTTARAAEKLANVTGGELYAIVSAQPYTSADLDWNDKRSRSSVEMNDPKSRPAIKSKKENIADYDVIFIGYPIWWGIAAWPVDTFVEANDFTGKTVIPFATSASSGLDESGQLLAELAGTGDWQEGMRFRSSVSEGDMQEWLDSLSLS